LRAPGCAGFQVPGPRGVSAGKRPAGDADLRGQRGHRLLGGNPVAAHAPPVAPAHRPIALCRHARRPAAHAVGAPAAGGKGRLPRADTPRPAAAAGIPGLAGRQGAGRLCAAARKRPCLATGIAPGRPARGGGTMPGPRSTPVEVDGRVIHLTNLDKVLWPQDGYTKAHLIRYYAQVAPVMLPHLRGRPLTVTRWPEGVTGPSFYQKNAPPYTPRWVRTWRAPHRDPDSDGKKPIDYILAQDTATLVWLANQACIELHPWLSKIGRAHV